MKRCDVFIPVLTLCLCGLATPIHAQTTIVGSVQDDGGEPVALANVQLLRAADSSFVHGTIADEEGRFVLNRVNAGSFILYASLIGYRDYVSEPFAADGDETVDVGAVTLAQGTLEMSELTVEARRTLYEQKGNRLVINVGSSISLAGGSALDILKRSPGVVVNEQSGTISMLGKDGVRVMIDGRLRYLDSDALVSFLAGLGADNIESIELITTPPAEFDAEGNAGFINIDLKQSPDEGLSGSVSATGGYGFRQGEIGRGNIDIHYGRRALRLDGSYSLLWDGQKQLLTNFRRITAASGSIELPAASRRDPLRRVHNFSLGADYTLNESTTVGAVVSGYQNKFSMDALTRVTVTADGAPITRSESDIDMFNRWRHVMGSASLRHKPKISTTLGLDVDYLRYHNEMPTHNRNTSTDITSGLVTEELLSTGKKTPLSIAVAKADYTTEVRRRWTVGAGVKAAFSRFSNVMTFSEAAKEDWVENVSSGTRGNLREDVLAAYGTADYRLSDATAFEVGLRYEFTDSRLDTDEEDGLVDRRWGRYFPSAVYTQKLSDASQVVLSYTRRVSRPAFNDLASFSRFDDPYTLFTGNAGLQPAVIDAVKLDLTFKSLLASFEYAKEDSSIVAFQSRIAPERNVHIIFPTNFRYTETATALLGLPVQPAGSWSMQNNVMISRQRISGFRNEEPLTTSRTSLRLNSTHNVSLPYSLRLEANGFYQNATSLGAARWESMWGVNVALQRALPRGNGRLTLGLDDVFDSVKWSWITGSAGDPLYIEQLIDMSHRTFKLTYSRRFGGGRVKRDRSAASAEESARVQ